MAGKVQAVPEIPIFDGTLDSWPPFRYAFEEFIHNSSMGKDIKMKHLVKLIQGEAKSVLCKTQSYPFAYDYDNNWNRLMNKYNSPKVLMNYHLKQLFDLSLENQTEQDIWMSIGKIEGNLNFLKQINSSVESWDPILLFMLSRKLDLSTQDKWKINMQKKDKPTINDFLEFLTAKGHALAEVEVQKK